MWTVSNYSYTNVSGALQHNSFVGLFGVAGPVFSTVSKHRWARQSPGHHQLKGCQWAHVLAIHFSRVVIKIGTATLKYDCRPHWIPTIIGLEYCQSDNACMPLDQSAVNCCLIVACLYLERSSMPLDQWALLVLSQGKAFFFFFFLPCNKTKFKGQLKILVQ